MSYALKQTNRLCIPPRDKSRVAKPMAAMASSGENARHCDQVKNAFDFGFSRYEKAMKELSKV